MNTKTEETIIEPAEEKVVIENTEPVKKRRGRKPNAEKLVAETMPESPASDSAPVRKRGRKKANTNATAQLIGLHKMIAMLPNMQHFEIDETEAAVLSDAMQQVSEEYGVVMSGKTGATINLIIALGMVYGPRFYLTLQQRKEAQAKLQLSNSEIPEATN